MPNTVKHYIVFGQICFLFVNLGKVRSHDDSIALVVGIGGLGIVIVAWVEHIQGKGKAKAKEIEEEKPDLGKHSSLAAHWKEHETEDHIDLTVDLMGQETLVGAVSIVNAHLKLAMNMTQEIRKSTSNPIEITQKSIYILQIHLEKLK